ncbi:2-oxoglutarate dehydrogenase complex dihydrolipoyllysine-residue succinyltransferase [Aquibium carbonis]|uniref:Dihydrolipoyllysine-residue succinyltransferase component of 2-oxoglutarate dehydrogenase complex n=1 Tax=Aquibium carbonis TaxID=2495581 RepID=A0A3S0AVQ0_9HYPH|nr:2-oxoglutarate dehydrogenase complex dihydrolipoyllysine-residue succinyltransferase [Aquibium carbonis]RST88253.1 2-oxoglutarate dehydrogenase complex dihydrolipoyllysine-residue succinyltransferase [Aquibium carbonis]
MATEIRVPTLGESVSEATIGKWFKQPGDAVVQDEPLLELETDKVTLEVPAPAAGKLAEITAKEGETVGVGALLGMIGEGAGAAPAPKKDESASVAQASGASGSSTVKDAQDKTAELVGGEVTKRDMPAAPSAAKLMAEKNLSADQVEGSGKRGQILKGDVLDAISRGAPAQPAEAPKVPRTATAAGDEGREERVKMTRLRQTIARRLKDAQNSAAMLTTFNEVDMKAVMDLRTKYKDVFEKKHGVKLGFMGFFSKAVTHALKEIPAVNAEIDGTDIIYKNYCHIGVAVGTDKGLVVPVVRDADQMSIAEIEKEIGRLGIAARDGKLSMADMQGGTFTISNGGVYGSLMSTPILNAPQSGILGMHKIQERPMVVGGQIVIRPMMYLALSYDHRIVDGKEAVTFLVRVKESLEDPERLVLDL